MRCRACNADIRVSYWTPKGCTEPVLEELCAFCKSLYPYENYWDGGNGDVIEELISPRKNKQQEWHDDYYGGIDEMDEEG